MPAKISQDAAELFLEWVANDPVSLEWVQQDAGPFVGDYTMQIRDRSDTVLAAPIVTTARVAGPDGIEWDAIDISAGDPFTADEAGSHLRVTVTLADSSDVPHSTPFGYDIQQDAGVTRWRGTVTAIKDYTR